MLTVAIVAKFVIDIFRMVWDSVGGCNINCKQMSLIAAALRRSRSISSF